MRKHTQEENQIKRRTCARELQPVLVQRGTDVHLTSCADYDDINPKKPVKDDTTHTKELNPYGVLSSNYSAA